MGGGGSHGRGVDWAGLERGYVSRAACPPTLVGEHPCTTQPQCNAALYNANATKHCAAQRDCQRKATLYNATQRDAVQRDAAQRCTTQRTATQRDEKAVQRSARAMPRTHARTHARTRLNAVRARMGKLHTGEQERRGRCAEKK